MLTGMYLPQPLGAHIQCSVKSDVTPPAAQFARRY